MENIVKNELKRWSKNNEKCTFSLIHEWIKTKNQCKIYSISNAKYTPKIMQNVVQKEWKLHSNTKRSTKVMQHVVKKSVITVVQK